MYTQLSGPAENINLLLTYVLFAKNIFKIVFQSGGRFHIHITYSGNALARVQRAAGARTGRSLGHQLLHPQILRLLEVLKPVCFEAQSSLL